MCLKVVSQLLNSRSQNFPEKQCILDALATMMTSNTYKFMGIHFTQIDGAAIGEPESASATKIYGTVFIDSKIEENVINENEDWKLSVFSISWRTCEERETEKS